MKITSYDSPLLDDLCHQLTDLGEVLERTDAWPGEQLRLCGEYGVFEWFLPPDLGGQGWPDSDLVQGYLRLSAACLTTTFVITQRMGACRRIAGSGQSAAIQRWMPDLIAGSKFTTVGISHLTTSRRHLTKPAMMVKQEGGGRWVFDGYSAWVTGARFADVVVTGGSLQDGRQLLVALPTDAPGVESLESARLIGLSASQTGPMNCHNVLIEPDWILAGPADNVMSMGVGAATGGLQTSTLAVGLADAATRWLLDEATRRDALTEAAEALRQDWQVVHADLLASAAGAEPCTLEDLRSRANSLALRAAQAALAAAKGAGYVVGHPAGRWCREALFFLVWSCPQPVMQAYLCELAGLETP